MPSFFDRDLLALADHVKTLTSFNETYGPLIPPELEGLVTLTVSLEKVSVTLHCPHDEERRTQMLAFIGHTFGVNGWISKPQLYSDYYNWHRAAHGVELVVQRAEVKPEEVERPVPPTQFPLMILDTERKVQEPGQDEDEEQI